MSDSTLNSSTDDYGHGHDAEGNALGYVWGEKYEIPEKAEDETYAEWRRRVFTEAVGAASVTWGGGTRGVFDESRALSIVDAIEVVAGLEQPPLHPDAARAVYADGSTPRVGDDGIPVLEDRSSAGSAAIHPDDDNGARLGLATTDQLLSEIRARIATDYVLGAGGLNYTTVGGRPE